MHPIGNYVKKLEYEIGWLKLALIFNIHQNLLNPPRAFRRPLKGMFRHLLGRHHMDQDMDEGKRALGERFRSRLMDGIAKIEQEKGAPEKARADVPVKPYGANLGDEIKALPPRARPRTVRGIRRSFFQ